MSSRDAYVAIADPTRREILTLLRDHKRLAAGEIAAHFRESSRPGISRHLRVLRECGVVDCVRQGKQQHYMVNPKPLTDIHNEFLAGFATMQVRSLKALRATVERNA